MAFPPESGLADRLVTGKAWREWCERLAAVGERILADDFPDDARTRAEGFRSLTRLLAYATQMEMEAGDPDFPFFYRYEDRLTQWGGPNPDNVYLRATIDPSGTYRVWGNVAGVRQAILSLHEGDMQLEQYGVYSERSLDELETDSDGRLELIVSPEEHAGNWMPMHESARLLMIRVYQSDWERDAIPVFHIERVGNEGRPPPVADPARVARALDRAMTWVERSVPYWNTFIASARQRAEENVLSPPRSVPGGADHIAYGSGFWNLAEGEALLVESEAPDADYWNFTIHTPTWFESGDFADRQTSLSGHQMHVDPDGRFRLVVAHRDPGAPNWIDTEDRPVGLLAYRFVWARTTPTPTGAVVPLAQLRSRLPAGHPTVGKEERRAALARRRAAAYERYR